MKIQRLGFSRVSWTGKFSALTAFGDNNYNNYNNYNNSSGTSSSSSNYSPVQLTYRPLGWSIYDKVQVANCDTLWYNYESDQATFLQMVNSSLTEGMKYVAAGQNALSPQELYFYSDYARRIYFFMNSGGYTDAGRDDRPRGPVQRQTPGGNQLPGVSQREFLLFEQCPQQADQRPADVNWCPC